MGYKYFKSKEPDVHKKNKNGLQKIVHTQSIGGDRHYGTFGLDKSSFPTKSEGEGSLGFSRQSIGESYNGYYMRRCCREVQDLKRKEQCTAGKKDFSSFLHEANCCMDTHWEPHARKIDLK